MPQNSAAELQASPVSFNTSGDTVNFNQSNGFVELNAEKKQFEIGEIVKYYAW